jgi:hypothetical protein
LALPAFAHDYEIGELTVDHPWARASAGQMKTGAAYLTITNDGEQADRLIGLATPVAERAALHTVTMEGNIAKMRAVQAVEIKPGEPAVLEPGGVHIMLIGLRAPLEEGETFPITLTFEKTGKVDVEVIVFGVGATHH